MLHVRQILIVNFLFLASFASVVAFPDGAAIGRAPHHFDTMNELVEIETSVTAIENSETEILRNVSDFHLLADVSLDAMIRTMTDRDAQVDILPRLHEYDWEPIPGSSGNAGIEIQVVGVRFMGFDGTYRLRQRSELIDRRDSSPREAVIRYRMIESLDDKLESSEGTYLLREVIRDGVPFTYIRQQNVTEIRDPFFGMKALLRRFTRFETRKMFEALIDAARERVAAAQ